MYPTEKSYWFSELEKEKPSNHLTYLTLVSRIPIIMDRKTTVLALTVISFVALRRHKNL